MKNDTGQPDYNNEDLILKMIQNEPIPNDLLCQRFMKESETSKPTYYRTKKALTKKGEIKSFRANGKLWVGLPGSGIPVMGEPSEADTFLMIECEKMVSDIIASGLANPLPAPDEPARAGPEEALLLRRCASLHSTLQWLAPRRKWTLPVRWPTPMKKSYDPRGWFSGQKAWYTGSVEVWSSPMKGQLHGWMIYYISIVDFLGRKSVKSKTKGKNNDQQAKK